MFVDYFGDVEGQQHAHKWSNNKDSVWSWFKVSDDFCVTLCSRRWKKFIFEWCLLRKRWAAAVLVIIIIIIRRLSAVSVVVCHTQHGQCSVEMFCCTDTARIHLIWQSFGQMILHSGQLVCFFLIFLAFK